MNILDEKFAEFQYNDQHDFTNKNYRRIYFGTDYDNQRIGRIFKIACNNDM